MSSFVEKHPELLGLGEDEVKVYKLLNEVGESSAKVISTQANIPYSRIHAVLYRMQQEELLISRGETPKLFALRFKDPELSKLWPGKRGSRGRTSGG
jgi:sugar-specific transcriptional regulator TrmB